MTELVREALDMFNIRHGGRINSYNNSAPAALDNSSRALPQQQQQQHPYNMATAPLVTANADMKNVKPRTSMFDQITQMTTKVSKYIYPTITLVPLVIVLILVAVSSMAMTVKMITIFMLIFVLLIYYIQFKKWSKPVTTTPEPTTPAANVQQLPPVAAYTSPGQFSRTVGVGAGAATAPHSFQQQTSLIGQNGQTPSYYGLPQSSSSSSQYEHSPAMMAAQKYARPEQQKPSTKQQPSVVVDKTNQTNFESELDAEVAKLMTSPEARVAVTETGNSDNSSSAGTDRSEPMDVDVVVPDNKKNL